MAPTASGLGLRVRLLGTNERKPNVFVAQPAPSEGYSVNLESSKTKIERAAVEAAAARLQAQAYVSETEIGDEHWYRLRVGPFSTRAEAERVLKIAHAPATRARGSPKATSRPGLTSVERAGVTAAAAAAPTDPALAGCRARPHPAGCAHGARRSSVSAGGGSVDPLGAPAGVPGPRRSAGIARHRARACRPARAGQGGIPGIPAPLSERRRGRARAPAPADAGRRVARTPIGRHVRSGGESGLVDRRQRGDQLPIRQGSDHFGGNDHHDEFGQCRARLRRFPDARPSASATTSRHGSTAATRRAWPRRLSAGARTG